jgi:hypothetical protein
MSTHRRRIVLGRAYIRHMKNFNLVLRHIVFFVFPVPFLLSFGVQHGDEWTGYAAYAAAAVLALAAAVAGWTAISRDDNL